MVGALAAVKEHRGVDRAVSYFLVEVPSSLALQKVGARRWIARIMISWGLVQRAWLSSLGLTRSTPCASS